MLVFFYRRLIVVILTLCIFSIAQGQIKFSNPVPGLQGHDYWIVNYIDHDSTGFLQDSECGTKTYDGHEGTDFVIRSFRTMDSGIAVYAIADGVVTQTKDSLFDRSKQSNSLGLGNYIGINHMNKYWAYYGHLKRYSLLVNVGDTVKAGDTIGMIGSSGNSTDPHLHLEVYDVSSNIVDPFLGSCNSSGQSLWGNQPHYDTSIIIIDKGISGYVPDLDTLRERYSAYRSQGLYLNKDTAVNIWVQLQGVRKGDIQRVDWYDTTGKVFYSYSHITQQDYWYYYFWSYINVPPAHSNGKNYNVKYYINSILYADIDFVVKESLTVSEFGDGEKAKIYPNPVIDELHIISHSTSEMQLYNAIGHKLQSLPENINRINMKVYPAGIYYLKIGIHMHRIIKL